MATSGCSAVSVRVAAIPSMTGMCRSSRIGDDDAQRRLGRVAHRGTMALGMLLTRTLGLAVRACALPPAGTSDRDRASVSSVR